MHHWGPGRREEWVLKTVANASILGLDVSGFARDDRRHDRLVLLTRRTGLERASDAK